MHLENEIEAHFPKLINQLGRIFTSAELDLVNEYFDANEWGLALETAIAIIEDEKYETPIEALVEIRFLAGIMEIDIKNFQPLTRPS